MKPWTMFLSIVFLILAGFMPVSGQMCDGCKSEYWGDWYHHFDPEWPPMLSECFGVGNQMCSQCHTVDFEGHCANFHDDCASPDLDLDALVASATDGDTDQEFQRFLNQYREYLTYDESLEAVRVTDCASSVVALIPISPEAYRVLSDQ